MNYSMELKEKSFSPKEAAEITGVSTTLQRDWRRRGVLDKNEGTRATFSVTDIIRLTVMRSFTNSGMNLEAAASFSAMAVLPVTASLVRWDTAIFAGDPLPEQEQERVRNEIVVGVSEEEQFSFVALPEAEDGSTAARLDKLSEAERIMGKSKSFHGIVVDHYGLAHHIADKCQGPIFTFQIKIKDVEGS